MSRRVFDSETMKAIGKRIREARLGASQGEFAKAIGIGRSVLSNYEAGRRLPNSEILRQIAEINGYSIDYILKGNLDKGRYIDYNLLKDNQDLNWGHAISIYVYQRLHNKIWHGEPSYSLLWWSLVIVSLSEHFTKLVTENTSKHNGDWSIGGRVTLQKLADQTDTELLKMVDKHSDRFSLNK